jgi:hypothetical protein
MRVLTTVLLTLLAAASVACAQSATIPATAPAGAKLPHIQVDVKAKQVRVEAETLGVDTMLEFFAVMAGTSEHEAVVRTAAKPSHIHLALLMIGLEPGRPVHYSEAAKKWLPPQGPPLRVTMEYDDPSAPGKRVSVPAYRWMRDVKTKKEMPPMTWIFAGSKVMEDGQYAADVTGYVITVVNFDLALIDIPNLASNANETLTWERNAELVPPPGTAVTMLIEPAGAKQAPPETATTAPSGPDGARGGAPGGGGGAAAPPQGRRDGATLTGVAADDAMIATLRQRWEQAVRPHGDELRKAAQTHYEVITALRREQQRIIDEADKIQRLIDALEKDYQDLTTPRPEGMD